MRFDVVRKLLERLQAEKGAEPLEDESLTASERAFGQMVLPVLRDRDELERKVDDLSRQVRALQVAIDQLPLPALLLAADGTLLALNRAADNLFGRSGVPLVLLKEARRLAASATRDEQAVEIVLGGKSVRLRLILGETSAVSEGVTAVFAVPRETTLPIDRSRLAERFGLTEAEGRVVELAAQGMTNNDIAEKLGVSFDTVRTHVSRSLAKMGVKNRSSLASAVVGASFGIGPASGE